MNEQLEMTSAAPKRFLPSPVLLSLAFVITLISVRFLWGVLQGPSHIEERIDECASIIDFYRMPIVDSTGNRISYTANTENGAGIFYKDISTGKSCLLYNQKEGDGQLSRPTLCRLFWSPDDTHFAYIHNVLHKAKGQEILIFDAGTGLADSILCDRVRGPFWGMSDFLGAWLTPRSFVYATTEPAFHLVQKQGLEWKETAQFTPPGLTNTPEFVAALSTNSLVFRQSNALWMVNISSPNKPVKLFEANGENPDLNTITAVSYSPENGCLLLSGAGTKHESLWQLQVTPSGSGVPSCVRSGESIRDAKWINGGKGYAFLIRTETNSDLIVQMDIASPSARPFPRGYVTDFTVSGDGKHMFAMGVVSNEIFPSVWKYDLEATSLQCVVSNSDQKLHYVQRTDPILAHISGPSGRRIDVKLYLPPDLNQQSDGRCPVVIGCPFMVANPDIPLYPAELANCGVIYADIQKSDESDEIQVARWIESIPYVNYYLAQLAYADTNRVFLSAASGETYFLSKFMSDNPGRWKGIIFLNPGYLPDIKALASHSHPKIFISAGALADGVDRIQKFQEQASAAGIRVDVFMRETSGHAFISKAALGERLKQMVKFIFDN